MTTGTTSDGRSHRFPDWKGEVTVASYEYRCDDCEVSFELSRPMGSAPATATCPAGHPGARRRLSVFATTAVGAGTGPGASAPSGGCCGGGCACAAPGR